MKKKLIIILLTITASITLGYLFFLSWLLGFLASKYVAGKSAGERGKVSSLVIPFRGWKIHFHHWFYSLFLLGLSSTTGIHFFTPTITYGLLAGLVFQGIYFYGDWHVILTSRGRATARDRSRGEVTIGAGTEVKEVRSSPTGEVLASNGIEGR